MGSWMIPTTWPAHRIFQAILAILAPKLCPPNIQAFMARTACHETPHVGGCGIRIFLWSFFFCVFVVPNFQTFVPEGLDLKTINPLKLAWLVDRCWPFLERYTDHAKKLLEEGCQVAPSIFPLSSFTNTCIFISCFQVLTTIPAFHDLVAVCISSEPLFKQGEKKKQWTVVNGSSRSIYELQPHIRWTFKRKTILSLPVSYPLRSSYRPRS